MVHHEHVSPVILHAVGGAVVEDVPVNVQRMTLVRRILAILSEAVLPDRDSAEEHMLHFILVRVRELI